MVNRASVQLDPLLKSNCNGLDKAHYNLFQESLVGHANRGLGHVSMIPYSVASETPHLPFYTGLLFR